MHVYDLARCHAAIEAVERRDKPVAEIPIVVSVAQLGQLIDDVLHVVELTETGEIKVHIDYREGVALVAFYRYGWCRAALELLKGGGFPPPALHWIQGLLFGYNPEAIERFIAQLGAPHEDPRRRLPALRARRESLMLAERDLLVATRGFVDA